METNRANTDQAIAALRERIRAGEIDATAANVEMVRIERFRLIHGRIPRDVRRALSAAVKSGDLGHLPKDLHKPEAFFHPTFAHLAHAARNEEQRRAHIALGAFHAKEFDAAVQS